VNDWNALRRKFKYTKAFGAAYSATAPRNPMMRMES
jgi:hypothetical protein